MIPIGHPRERRKILLSLLSSLAFIKGVKSEICESSGQFNSLFWLPGGMSWVGQSSKAKWWKMGKCFQISNFQPTLLQLSYAETFPCAAFLSNCNFCPYFNFEKCFAAFLANPNSSWSRMPANRWCPRLELGSQQQSQHRPLARISRSWGERAAFKRTSRHIATLWASISNSKICEHRMAIFRGVEMWNMT